MCKDSIVHVVDDDQSVREGIAHLVEDMGLIAKTYPSAENFLASFTPTRSECLVLDIRMPGMSGIELLKKLSEEKYNISTIIVTGHGDIPMAVEAMERGAVGFIEKPFREQALWEKIRKALDIAASSVTIEIERQELMHKLSLLTDRERYVLRSLLHGQSDKEIAIQLGIVRRSVAFHRANIFEKLGTSNMIELTKLISKLALSV
jgi:two-component system, LuxR family, response regulator FixJ